MTDSKFEKLVKDIMAECAADKEPVTREEAEEMAHMELGEKEIKRYEKSNDAPKERKKREVKKDAEKIEIIKKIHSFLLTNGFKSARIVNEQREIAFGDYSITLTKHRKKKGVEV